MTATSAKRPCMGLTEGRLLTWITFACSMDMLMFGYDQAVFSGVIVTDNFLELHDLVGPSRTNVLSTVTAIYDAILTGTAIMSVGAILMSASFSLPQMFVGRIILGLGNGINTSTAPIWQTETAPAHLRGKLVMFEMMMNIVGFSLCNWINFGLSFASGAVAWRLPLALQFVFILSLFATVPWLPESPRWLVYHSRDTEAKEVVACLAAKPLDDPIVLAQCEEIKYGVAYEKEHAVRWRDLLKSTTPDGTKPLRRLLLGAGTQFIQQFEVLTVAVGLSNELARLLTAVNSVTYLILSCISITLVESGGSGGETNRAAEASIVFFFLYFMSFGFGMLGVPWLYPTEINSVVMWTKGAAVATATNWITNFVIVQITPIGIQNLGWKFWIVFTVFNAFFMPVIYFFYPETGNKPYIGRP
ncbi:hypothetical protein Sste5346_009758 [Sporothrix stenoceras]|uniref:Major facilitator superfamily (MFS) profile domain-containing protein n=1 Tax=Sporothrix stenoceras TaxID=5173 RepID=A0ABR3YJY4_9PEZI